MDLKSLLEKKKFEASTKKETEWQQLGKELTEKFGTNLYWVPWKFPIWMIRDKLKTAGDNGLSYFLGALKNELKKGNQTYEPSKADERSMSAQE